MKKNKMIVIAPVGVRKYSEYLTDSKEYDIYNKREDLFCIKDDEGDEITCAWTECAHLPEGTSWTIKN